MLFVERVRFAALIAVGLAGCLSSVVPDHPGKQKDAGVTDMAMGASPDMAMPAASTDMAVPFALRINVNGPAVNGVSYPGLWGADPGAPGGVCGDQAATNAVEINGTDDDPLFVGEVYGNPVTCAVGAGAIPAGTYKVNLYFAEIYFGPGCPGGGAGTGSRVFDIALEGNTVLQNFDIFSEGGCAASTTDTATKPVVKSFTVTINDGTLDVSLPATVDNGKISAIEILSM